MSSIFLNCSLCKYKTNKKFNLERHIIGKHNKLETEIKKENNMNDDNCKLKNTDFFYNKNDEYIYLFQEREFIKTKEPIYKIGKTKQPCLDRLKNYPIGTSLIFQIKCNDCDIYERLLISKFKEEFIHKSNIGNEYFMGNYFDMIDIIYNLIWEKDIKNGKLNNNIIINNNDNKCIKCNKILSSKYYLEKHLLICKGVSNPLECHLCHKILANSSSKSRHLKNCKLSLINNEQPSMPINNITNNIDTCTNIIVFNPNNPNGKSLKTDHINLEFISKLLKIKEEDAFSLYTKKILDNPENRCIKKTNLRSTFSEIHVGNNKWNSYYDSDIYPKFISEISNCLCELLVDNFSTNNKLIEFLDYMSDNDIIKNKINKKHKELIQRIKAIVYNLKVFI
jgi:hypothetical protein